MNQNIKERSLRENPWLTGMTLRDVFAVAIVQRGGDAAITTDAQADFIWQQADLMVARREGGSTR